MCEKFLTQPRGDEKNFFPYENSLNITSFQEHSEERENALF